MTRYIVSDGTPENKVVVRDKRAALEIASLVSGFGDTGTATIEEVEGETQRGEGGLGSTGTWRAELDRLLDAARKHEMTSHELAEQRASWVRGGMGMGADADEAAYREKMRKEFAVKIGVSKDGVEPNEITRENVVARRRKAPPRGMGVEEFMSELERTHPELVDEVAYREKMRKGKE